MRPVRPAVEQPAVTPPTPTLTDATRERGTTPVAAPAVIERPDPVIDGAVGTQGTTTVPELRADAASRAASLREGAAEARLEALSDRFGDLDGRLSSHHFLDHDDFFDHDDDFFFHRSRFFFGHHPFVFGHFFSPAELLALEIRAEMLDDCLDRLHSNFSFVRLAICEHLWENLVEDLDDLFFDDFFFPWWFFGSGIFSFGDTHAVFGHLGGSFSSVSTNVVFGPVGVQVAGAGGVFSFGPTGFAGTFPGAGSEDVGVLLFAPFFGVTPFHGSFFGFRHFGLHGFHHRLHHSSLFRRAAFADRFFGVHDFHRSLVLRTIHAHSFFDGPLHHGFFSPFGHRTVFFASHHLFTPTFFFVPLFFGGFFTPVLDLPGITIGANPFWHWARWWGICHRLHHDDHFFDHDFGFLDDWCDDHHFGHFGSSVIVSNGSLLLA